MAAEQTKRNSVERKWFEGVRLEYHPSEQDISQMKVNYHYSPGFIHIAVVGSAGAGKSSLSTPSVACPEMIPWPLVRELSRPLIPSRDTLIHPRTPGYDIPGSGTAKVSDWQHFNDMGLYIFDCVIVLIDNRVLQSNLAILRACGQFKNIEAYIVHFKSDQYINNTMSQSFDLCDPDRDDETRSLLLPTRLKERQRFVDETCEMSKWTLRGTLPQHATPWPSPYQSFPTASNHQSSAH
ncbi:uncharacterized protein EDB93DRAFT_192199 [Suillus bovinus]|uniref:uncharacterized protein n=1 Tax=Suillus bovinus TaxID=48563 RepID=UPI001B85FEA6|nr:uncharacterized protein EDB93DRAFT_192199 [Suillus bovinus]KAG2154267.1 hypothetical protein EDB93DRAFT_192199 [Suillus bovinus]